MPFFDGTCPRDREDTLLSTYLPPLTQVKGDGIDMLTYLQAIMAFFLVSKSVVSFLVLATCSDSA